MYLARSGRLEAEQIAMKKLIGADVITATELSRAELAALKIEEVKLACDRISNDRDQKRDPAGHIPLLFNTRMHAATGAALADRVV
jgi:hypothetical protein